MLKELGSGMSTHDQITVSATPLAIQVIRMDTRFPFIPDAYILDLPGRCSTIPDCSDISYAIYVEFEHFTVSSLHGTPVSSHSSELLNCGHHCETIVLYFRT
jgi:hypothetical protein